MGLFSFIQEIAMDLGTANTIIISDDKIVVDEPSVVALDRRTDKMIAVGGDAKMMYEKEHPNIRTIRPLRDGVIADFTACEQMMRGLIKMVHTGNRFFSPSLRMVIGVPSGSTEVELRAVRDSAEHADGRDVYLIFEPMAAALGMGLDVEAPEGNMIVDIGGGSTEIAVISLGGIVCNNSIRVAGDDLTADIQEYMSRQHNVKVSERMAERIKLHVGSALTDLGEEAPEDYIVHGPNRITALPMEVPVCYQEIAHCLDKTVAKIENAVLSALENTPPELYADIVKNGIYLSGGKYKHWFLFVALEVLSMVLLFRFNDYQGSVWFTSANYVAGLAYEGSSKVTSYLTMGEVNEALTKRNLELEQQVKALSAQLYDKTKDSTFLHKGQYRFLSKFRLIQAKVVANSLDKPNNFITINKGTWDGVQKDMGVACGNGVVGIVYMAGIHYAVVIPVLNSKSNISCSIQGRDYFGYLHWNGGASDVAYLDDIPRHAKFKLGDRVVTSGYSSVFPAGVLVGKVKHVYNSEDGLSYRLQIQLSTDFGNLRDVCVIDDASIRDQREVIKAAQDSIKPIEEQIGNKAQ